jgi:hypothetical protein
VADGIGYVVLKISERARLVDTTAR